MSEEAKAESPFKHHLDAARSDQPECEGESVPCKCVEADVHKWDLCEKGKLLLAEEDGAEQYL